MQYITSLHQNQQSPLLYWLVVRLMPVWFFYYGLFCHIKILVNQMYRF